MKITFLIALLFTVSALAEDKKKTLQKVAEDKYLGDTEVITLTGKPRHERKIRFHGNGKVDKVEISYPENLLERQNDDTTDVMEIFIHSKNDVLNCYATFIDDELKYLTKCAEVYPEKVSGYGN